MKRVPILFCIVIFTVITNAQSTAAPDVPAFHAVAPAKTEKLGILMPREYRKGENFSHAAQRESYKQAEQIDKVLYQLPCYCYCDRGHGHTSLRSCFESEHASVCGTCMQEEIYAFNQHNKGWTAKMIRAGIIRGDYKTIDLASVKDSQ